LRTIIEKLAEKRVAAALAGFRLRFVAGKAIFGGGPPIGL
jgi:hypothetical protein